MKNVKVRLYDDTIGTVELKGKFIDENDIPKEDDEVTINLNDENGNKIYKQGTVAEIL